MDTADLIDQLRAIAKRHGWALGVHGSLVRDIDLIAVPWTAEAAPWTAVYDEWLARLPLRDTEGAYRDRPPQRPHNRKSMLILQAGSIRVADGNPKGAWSPPCLDVSFMVPIPADHVPVVIRAHHDASGPLTVAPPTASNDAHLHH